MLGKIVLLYFCVFLLNFVHSRRFLTEATDWLNYSEAEARCSSNRSIISETADYPIDFLPDYLPSDLPLFAAYYIDCFDEKYERIEIKCNKENGTVKKEVCLDEQLTSNLAIYKVKNLKPMEVIRWFNRNPQEIRVPVEVYLFVDTFHALLLTDFTEDVDVMSEALANLLSLDWFLFDIAPGSWHSLLLVLEIIIMSRDQEIFSMIDLTKISILTVYDINVNWLEEDLLLLSNGNVSIIQKDWDLNSLDFEIAVRIPADARKYTNSKGTLAVINKPRDNLVSSIFKFTEGFYSFTPVYWYFNNVKNDGSNYTCVEDGLPLFTWNSWNYIPGEFIAKGLSNVYSCRILSYDWLAVGLQEPTKLECLQERVNNLTFPKTEAGVVATTQEFCLQQNHFPVVRKCSENGTWEKPSGKCSSSNADTSNTTLELYKASNPETKERLQILHNISKEPQHLSPVDVIYAAKILENSKNDLQLSIEVINNLMEIPKEILNETQQLLNSTDRILGSLDKLFTNYYFRHVNMSLSNILVKTVENFNGVIVQNGKIDYFEDTSFLDSEEFDVAFVMKDPRLLHLVWFKNDHLFNSVREKQISASSILNILQQFPQKIDVTIYFKRTQCTLEPNPDCSFWKYGHDATNKPIKGRWKAEIKSQFFKPNYYSCRFNHTTHFGLLLSDDLKDNFILDVITIVGYALSFVGFLVILTTAVTFKRWRQDPNHKVLLNVSFCLFLLISTFFLSSAVPAGYYCIMTGMLLHYLCLSYFFWTFVISISSYRNFVNVFATSTQSVSMKCYFCWGCPLVIIFATAFTSLQSYDKICDYSNQLCYPKGQYLTFFVILPIGIILACNTIIYSMIIVSITKKYDIRKNRVVNTYAVQKASLVFFVMMGLTWIFGVVGIFIEMFLYVFCLLATLHGFIMMIFYIFDAKDARTLWKDKFERILMEVNNKKNSNSETTTDGVKWYDSLD